MHDGAEEKRCLVCIPTYDELENLPGIVPAVFDVMPAADVLIIDDNSPDGTGDLADDMAKEENGITRRDALRRGALGLAGLALAGTEY